MIMHRCCDFYFFYCARNVKTCPIRLNWRSKLAALPLVLFPHPQRNFSSSLPPSLPLSNSKTRKWRCNNECRKGKGRTLPHYISHKEKGAKFSLSLLPPSPSLFSAILGRPPTTPHSESEYGGSIPTPRIPDCHAFTNGYSPLSCRFEFAYTDD